MDVYLHFTAGGPITDVIGLSYFMKQFSPGSPYPFSITNRNVSGSLFTATNTTLQYPQNLNPVNPDDLGALTDPITPYPSGTYFIARLTMFVSTNFTPGTYTIGVDTGRSEISASNFNSLLISASNFTIAVVPEPSTLALLGLAAAGSSVWVFHRRRSRHQKQAASTAFLS